MKSRGKEDPHNKKVKDNLEHGLPAMSMDYAEVGNEDEGQAGEKLLIGREDWSGHTFCHLVECKGLGDHHIVDKVLRSLQALSMSSPFQPGSTVSLSTSCCTLKASTVPVAIVQAPSRDPVVEFVGHLQRNGDSCGAADKSIIMNIALVSPAVTEDTSPRDSFSSSNCAFDNKRERNQCRRKGSQPQKSLA